MINVDASNIPDLKRWAPAGISRSRSEYPLLRFEPATDHDDLNDLVQHLDGVMAIKADQSTLRVKQPGFVKPLGEHLEVSFAQSNPRKLLERSEVNLGNSPNEILTHSTADLDKCVNIDKTLFTPCYQNLAMTGVRLMADVLTGTVRVLNTPLPLAYSFTISQSTWAYIAVLPFQLFAKLGWITIPGTLVAAYIIRGLAIIDREIENPFGDDMDNLPLNACCLELEADLSILMSMPMTEYRSFIESDQNRPFFKLSDASSAQWETQSIDEIRNALRARASLRAKTQASVRLASMATSRSMHVQRLNQ